MIKLKRLWPVFLISSLSACSTSQLPLPAWPVDQAAGTVAPAITVPLQPGKPVKCATPPVIYTPAQEAAMSDADLQAAVAQKEIWVRDCR